MKRKVLFYFSLATFLFALILLATGSPLLLKTILKDPYIPSGTLITWAGLIAWPAVLYLGHQRLENPVVTWEQYFVMCLKGLVFLSILWVPVSYFLAANLSFTFTEKATFRGGQSAMRIFWMYTYFLAGATLLWWIVYRIVLLFKKKG